MSVSASCAFLTARSTPRPALPRFPEATHFVHRSCRVSLVAEDSVIPKGLQKVQTNLAGSGVLVVEIH